MSDPLRLGKLPPDFLADLLSRYGARSRRVLTPPAVGEDAAAVLTSLPCMVAAMDPVTGARERIGHYAVHVNANDVATRGAEPAWFLFTLLLPPEEATRDNIAEIFRQVDEACREVGAELIGGHTEVTQGIDRPLAIGTMIGEITTFRLTSTRGARPGNAIIMVGSAGLEGTAILAAEHSGELRRHGVPDDVIDRASRFLDEPGISIVPAVRIAMSASRPHAMHDPTDGGVANALHEIARAARAGVELYAARIPVREETRVICDCLGLDAWGMMSSGSLLVCVDAVDVEALLAAYGEAHIEATHIGSVFGPDVGVCRVGKDDQISPITWFETDELLRFTSRS
jgi:hydrogenase maturation factor